MSRDKQFFLKKYFQKDMTGLQTWSKNFLNYEESFPLVTIGINTGINL